MKKKNEVKNPIQPIYEDEHGTWRFKENEIVRYLLDNGGLDLNHLAIRSFSTDDREQFAQLIGYSLSGYGSLSFVGNNSYETAYKMAESDVSELEAEVIYLRNLVSMLKEKLAEPMAELFEKHPDDLKERW